MQRITLFVVGVSLTLLAGGARLVHVAVATGPAFEARAQRQQTARYLMPALRGAILDTRGRVLADTLRRPSLFVDAKMVTRPRFSAYSIAPLIDRSPSEFERELMEWRTAGRRFVWLARTMPDARRAAIEKTLDARELNGFGIRWEPVRVYPQQQDQPIAAHVLGFVTRDLKRIAGTNDPYEDLCGRAGLEAAWEEQLSGRPAWRRVTVDEDGRPVGAVLDDNGGARDGASLVLTLDAYIQEVTQNALRDAVTKHNAEWGTAVVMDPHSGEVLAMATVPDPDPREPLPPVSADATVAERLLPWRNRAVSDSYEPGSIFKPFVAACALEDGLVGMNEEFAINGRARAFGKRIIHDTHSHGRLTFREIVSKSSNIGMGLIGERAGCARLYDYVTRLGFGARTGIGLAGEHRGLVAHVDDWKVGYSPQSVPMGQEIAVTPIQMVTAFSALCNGGLLLQPRIVRGVIGADGVTQADFSAPKIVRRVLAADTVEEFRREVLVEVVRAGTGKRAACDAWQVFGKTGTAQVARPNGGGYEEGAYVGSFVGGAPADDPRVVVLVSIYKPRGGGYYGGTVAAPAVRTIIAETLTYMDVPPDSPTGSHMARR